MIFLKTHTGYRSLSDVFRDTMAIAAISIMTHIFYIPIGTASMWHISFVPLTLAFAVWFAIDYKAYQLDQTQATIRWGGMAGIAILITYYLAGPQAGIQQFLFVDAWKMFIGNVFSIMVLAISCCGAAWLKYSLTPKTDSVH